MNDLSKYLPDAEALADMTPAEDVALGVSPDVPLSDIVLEPEVMPPCESLDLYVDVLFPHAPPGPAENSYWEVKLLSLLTYFHVPKTSIWLSPRSIVRCPCT